MKNNIICPVSKDKIPEFIPRIIAFINIGLITLFFFTWWVWILLFMLIDFYIRAFYKIKYSPVSLIAQAFHRFLGLSSKNIDKAPKIFAARLGFIMMFLTMVMFLAGNTVTVVVLLGLLAFLSTMECLFNFCVGCYIYNYFVFPFFNNKKANGIKKY